VIGALVLAGVCAAPPLFDLSGPTCTPIDQQVECRCSECITWPVVVGATFYAIERTKVSTGEKVNVGTTTLQIGVYLDENGNSVPWSVNASTVWCVARDSSTPQEGLLYEYRVKACNATGCSPFQGAACPTTQVDRTNCPVLYRAAPYACWHGGAEVACYTADPLIDRTVCYRSGAVIPCPVTL
jgi:hypothetical protein